MLQKILLTGAGGFIGTHISDMLNSRGVDFLNISNAMGGFRYPENTVLTSLSDTEKLTGALRDFQPDAVIHMAAIASPVHNDPKEVYDVNVCGTETLLEAIKQTCGHGVRVLLFSTAGVYGNQQRDFFEETDPVRPVNHYAASKAVMEFLSHNYSNCMEIRVVRPFNIIGTGQSEAFLVPKLVKAFQSRAEEISLGNMLAMRDYVSVEFCASAALDFLYSPTVEYPVMNICSGIGNTVQDVFDRLAHITGFRPKINISCNIVRHNEIWRLVGSTKRLDAIARSKKRLTLESILTRMLDI